MEEGCKRDARKAGEYICFSFKVLFKWILFGIITGISVGLVLTAFAYSLGSAVSYRESHPAMFYGLPFGGMVIVALYKIIGSDPGTNIIISAVRSEKEVPALLVPLIFVSTIVTHLFGGSAGREGAALQLGGGVSEILGKFMKISEKDRQIVIMCGMAAGFSAIFGTPLASAIFAMEVIAVGVMPYSALVPCVFSAFVANLLATHLGVAAESFAVQIVPELSPKHFIIIILLSTLFGLLSTLFCTMLHSVQKLLQKFFRNSYVRICVSAGAIILVTKLIGTTDYMGAGMPLVERAFAIPAGPEVFFLKMVLTALTLGAGFKGGEIVPSFCIGATFGSMLAGLLGLPVNLTAACGMLGVFCGVTNCPLTSLFIGFELFGFAGMPYYAISVAVSNMMSGYNGLYHEQKMRCSKFELEFFNNNK